MVIVSTLLGTAIWVIWIMWLAKRKGITRLGGRIPGVSPPAASAAVPPAASAASPPCRFCPERRQSGAFELLIRANRTWVARSLPAFGTSSQAPDGVRPHNPPVDRPGALARTSSCSGA